MKKVGTIGVVSFLVLGMLFCISPFISENVSAATFSGNISDDQRVWYNVNVNSTVQDIDIHVNWTFSSDDLNIYLYNPSGILIASDSSLGTNYRDIIYNPTVTGNYYLEIFGDNVTTNTTIFYDGYCSHSIFSGTGLTDSYVVTSPNGGESWDRGNTHYITWDTIGRPGNSVTIRLYRSGVLNTNIVFGTPNIGNYSWYISSSQSISSLYRIRIESSSNSSIYDESNSYFSIVSGGDSYEPDDIYTQASTIYSGSIQTHSIHDNGADIDWVRFTLSQARDVEIETSGSSGDTVMWLYSSSGVPTSYIDYDDDSGTGAFSYISQTGLSSGTYYVKIAEYGSSNDIPTYYLELTVSLTTSTITVLTPDGGESWEQGTSQYITWTSTGSPGNYVRIELYRSGSSYTTIVSSTSNDGSYLWHISSYQTTSSYYTIYITSTSSSLIYDSSDYYFSITSPSSITVTSPDGGESWEQGTSEYITWNYAGSPGSYVTIDLYYAGSFDSTIRSSTSNDGSYLWYIPSGQTLSTLYQIKITSTSVSSIDDYSDGYFSITSSGPSSIYITSPYGGESWQQGTTQTITWITYDGTMDDYVEIELYINDYYDGTIVSSTINDGSYLWSIPTDQLTSSYYEIKITSATDSTVFDYSNYFSITREHMGGWAMWSDISNLAPLLIVITMVVIITGLAFWVMRRPPQPPVQTQPPPHQQPPIPEEPSTKSFPEG